jgi:hypothetical protein
MMQNTCPGCGAILTGERTCQSTFDEFLVLEFTDPGYGAVHMLTVACFMIQHGQYSDQGLVWIEQRLRNHLENGVSTEQIRKQAAVEASQDQRSWKVTRAAGDPPQRKVDWSMTIIDVAAGYHDADSYCALVRQWARTTLREMKPLVLS